jgi:hypothetical protein
MAKTIEAEAEAKRINWQAMRHEVAEHRATKLKLLNEMTQEAARSGSWLYAVDLLMLMTDGEQSKEREAQLDGLALGFPTNHSGDLYVTSEQRRPDGPTKLLGVGHQEYPKLDNYSFPLEYGYNYPAVVGRIELDATGHIWIGRLCLFSRDYTESEDARRTSALTVNGSRHPVVATISRYDWRLNDYTQEESRLKTASIGIHFDIDSAVAAVDLTNRASLGANIEYLESVVEAFKNSPRFGGGD